MKDKTALLLVDIQKGFENNPFWGKRNNPEAEKNINMLLTQFRNSGLPIFHVQHLSTSPKSPLRPGQNTKDLINLLRDHV